MPLSNKDLWKLGRRFKIEVEVVDPRVEFKDGGTQGSVVFHTFATDVSDEDGNKLGFVSGGTGHVVLSKKGDNGMWMISHEDLWNAFGEGFKNVGPVPIIDRPPEPVPIVVEEPEPIIAEEPAPTLERIRAGEFEEPIDVVFLKITTYRGSLGASHWYGSLEPQEGESVEIQCVLTAQQAEKLSEPTFRWKEGDETTRWDSRGALIRCAVNTYKEHFPGAKVLIQGRRSWIQAQLVIAGLDEERDKLNVLYQKCEDLGWWDVAENKAEVNVLNDEWETLFNEALGQEV